MSNAALDEAMLDLSKPVVTRSGDPVKILAVLPPEYAIHGVDTIVALVDYDDDVMRDIHTYRADGSFFSKKKKSCLDLVNAP